MVLVTFALQFSRGQGSRLGSIGVQGVGLRVPGSKEYVIVAQTQVLYEP